MALEDYGTYTPTDSPGRLSIATNTITVTGMTRGDNVWLTKNKGSGHFGPTAFEHLVDFTVTAHTSIGAMGFWGIADSEDDAGTNVHAGVTFWYVTGPSIRLKCRTGVTDASVNLSEGTHYYCECAFDPAVGTYGTFTIRIYDDAARDVTDLVDTLTGAPTSAVSDRYIFAAVSYAVSGGTSITGTINNLDLQEGGGGTTYTIAASLDGVLQRQAVVQSANLDAALQKAFTASADLDAALAVLGTESVSLDAAVAATGTIESALDAVLRATQSETVSLDAALRAGKTLSASLDAALLISGSRSASLDAAIAAARSLTASLNAAIAKTMTVTVGLDAVITGGINAVIVNLDAALRKAAAVTTSLSGAVQTSGSLAAVLDGVLALSQVLTLSIDAVLEKTVTTAVNLDAAVRKGFSLSTSLDAVIGDVYTPVPRRTITVAARSGTITVPARNRGIIVPARRRNIVVH